MSSGWLKVGGPYHYRIAPCLCCHDIPSANVVCGLCFRGCMYIASKKQNHVKWISGPECSAKMILRECSDNS